jgi:hypothetical protein
MKNELAFLKPTVWGEQRLSAESSRCAVQIGCGEVYVAESGYLERWISRLRRFRHGRLVVVEMRGLDRGLGRRGGGWGGRILPLQFHDPLLQAVNSRE